VSRVSYPHPSENLKTDPLRPILFPYFFFLGAFFFFGAQGAQQLHGMILKLKIKKLFDIRYKI